jgi:hypothetical protein
MMIVVHGMTWLTMSRIGTVMLEGWMSFGLQY